MTKKILIIEDDNDLRETTTELLASDGFEVFAAPDGAAGIQLALRNLPDVIVCDINMPGITGYEVFNMLQQITTTSAIPFIFLSAKSSKEDILAGLHLGADDYITKPFEISDLVEIIKKRIEVRKKIQEVHDEKFNVLFKNTPTAACILNNSIFEYVNQPLEMLLGYTASELQGLSLTNLVHKNSLPSVLKAFEKCNEGSTKSFDIEFKAIKKNQQIVELQIKGSQVLFKGETKILGTISEVGDKNIQQVRKPKSVTVKLSDREMEVLNLVCQGYSNAEIAQKLFLSERTVEGHRSRLFSKSGTKNAVSLAMWAVKNNLVEV